MDLNLNGSVAVVAGGANGIGRAIATTFAQEGADVAIFDLADGSETAEAIASATGRKTIAVSGDICDQAVVEKARSEILESLGRIDHLVVAAAIGSGKFGYPFLNLEPEDWDRVLDVNVKGAVVLTHVFAPGLIEQRHGSIVFISSVAAQFGSQTDPPYSASKAALLNFGQCVAKDLAPHNVRVNSICPGMVQTSLNKSVWESWYRAQPPEKQQSYEDWAGDKVENVVPLRRWQTPEDIADSAVFLASEKARNITGQTINVDGGYIMR